MKTLYLVRHAKSSWEYPDLSDLERPLNERGKKDAPRMGKWLAQQFLQQGLPGQELPHQIQIPDLILSSPSVRTLATISKIGHELGLKGEHYHTDDRLYHASPENLWQIVRTTSEETKALMLVGHNPGLTEFASQACPRHAVDNIPTSGIFALQFNCKHWEEAAPKHAEFLFFQYPKSL